MFHQLVEDAGERSPEAVHTASLDSLRSVVEEVGRERAAESSGLDTSRVAALEAGEPIEVTLLEAAGILAASEEYPDAEAIAAEARDHLLLGMTTAVLDVDTIAANLGGDVSATGIQQRIEGRAEMPLEEYARLHAFIESRKR